MNHAACRRLLVEGDRTPECAAHLDACAACSAYAAQLHRVLATAPSLAAGSAPAGLADAVLAQVRSGGLGVAAAASAGTAGAAGAAGMADATAGVGALAASGGGLRVRAGASWRQLLLPRRTQIALGVAAALVLGAVARAWVGGGGGGPATELQPRLAAAVQATTARHTALIDISGRSTWRAAAPSLPDSPDPGRSCPTVPPLPPLPEGIAQDLAAKQHQQAEQLLAACQHRATATRPADASGTVVVTGSGQVDFAQGLHLAGTSKAPDHPCLQVHWDITTLHEQTYVLEPDGSVRRGPSAPGALGTGFGTFATVLVDPNAITRLAAQSRDVTDMGEETVDGQRLHHYRFTKLPPVQLSDLFDYWVGVDDGLVHRLTATGRGNVGGGTTWENVMTLRLHDFGAAVTIPAPKGLVGALPFPVGPAVLLYPLGMSVSFSLCHFDVKLPPMPTLPPLPSLPSLPPLPTFKLPDFP